MSTTKAYVISLAVGLLWLFGSSMVTQEIWEPTPIKNALVVVMPFVLIVMILRDVLQRRGRNTAERSDSSGEASQ